MECVFINEEVTLIGDVAVDFIYGAGNQRAQPYIFLFSHSLWEIKIHNSQLEINEILIDDRAVPPTQSGTYGSSLKYTGDVLL